MPGVEEKLNDEIATKRSPSGVNRDVIERRPGRTPAGFQCNLNNHEDVTHEQNVVERAKE
jgi:hypothetical protein